MRKLFEFIEILFRSYRLSQTDIQVMDKKGYYFHARKGRWVKSNDKRGWVYEH
jgi:hypothetical protein